MDLSICIVSYNVREDLHRCLSSIRDNLKDMTFELIVVDNCSQDGTASLVRRDFPFVRLVENKENLGFARANNIAYRFSTGRVLLFLNPDTVFLPGSFRPAVERFEKDPSVGALGPKLLNSDLTCQRGAVRRFPRIADTLIRLTFLRKIPGLGKISRKYRMDGFDFQTPSDVEQISGAAFFVKRSVFERVGLFDENFFIFYEEVDLCRRIVQKGCRISYDPSMQIVHTGGQSRKQDLCRIRSINIRSLLYYFRKHESGIRKAFFLLSFKTLFILDLVLETFVDGVFSLLPFLRKRVGPERKEKSEFRRYFIRNNLRDFLFHW